MYADTLSRLDAPDTSKTVPKALEKCRRVSCPEREATFYRTLCIQNNWATPQSKVVKTGGGAYVPPAYAT